MTSIYRSFQQIGSARQHQQSQRHILNAINEYQDPCDSDEDINTISQQNEILYNGFQNKKTVKIKPVNMFKDLISLQRENEEKKLKIRKLQALNEQLKIEYDQCIEHNQQLQAFLKEVEFTFQPERKKPQTSEVLLKAKRTLHQEAKEAQEKMKKMFKNTEASSIQEVKVYISTLELHKQELKKSINKLKSMVAIRSAQQDFNFIQTKKFEKGCKKVREALDNQIQTITKRHEQYRIEKMVIKGKVKSRNLECEKNNLRDLTENYKKMLLQFQGLQYEIGLLKHRIKDKKKENIEYEQLLEKIKMKESNIVRLQKELRQKKKTFQYMHQWSRQLKKQLEDRKSEHAKKKAEYESEINALTAEYQKISQSYKAGLFQEQVAKRKGPKDQDMLNVVKQPLLGKQVAFEEIKQIVKALTFHLLDVQCPTKQFIDSLLVIRETVLWQTEKDGKKNKNKNLVLVDSNQSKDTISLQNLITNFEMNRVHNLCKEQYVKIARFAIEDGSGKADLLTSASISVVRQVLNKLLQREIEDKADLQQAGVGLNKLLKRKGADIRHDIKLIGGRTDDIDIGSVSKIIGKYCNQPFSCNLFTQYIEFYSWKKKKVVGWTTFEDYEQIVSFLKSEKIYQLQ